MSSPIPLSSTPTRARAGFGRAAAALSLFLSWPLAAPCAEAGLWYQDGQLRPEAREAVAILSDAGKDGLQPGDYAAAALARAVDGAASLDASAKVRLDLALSRAMESYLHDLHAGRVAPEQVDENFPQPADLPFGAEGYLHMALAEHRLGAAVREAAPRHPQYAKLRELLARYRKLAADPVWATPLPALPGRKLEPGQAWRGAGDLARRLRVLGDLPAEAAPLAERYAGALVDAVKAFQLRHGLDTDGVIGRGTYAELNTGPAERVAQIELSMERLRWLPDFTGDRLIAVNVPEFALRTLVREGGGWHARERMRVIVGRAKDGHTPVFDQPMRYIEFSPYWNVPPSIAKKELIPHLRRDPRYFSEQGFEFVRADGQVIRSLSTANLDAVQHGRMRIRQRPNEHNPLGDIKFAFPNQDNIYLHHTASPRLFEKSRRDFSHGCVRVDDPVGLARFVLADAPEWNEERIRSAMDKGDSSFLRLPTEVPVLITYITAVVGDDGRAYFYADLYGHDAVLQQALAARQHALPALP